MRLLASSACTVTHGGAPAVAVADGWSRPLFASHRRRTTLDLLLKYPDKTFAALEICMYNEFNRGVPLLVFSKEKETHVYRHSNISNIQIYFCNIQMKH
jgi:hypothetical protein